MLSLNNQYDGKSEGEFRKQLAMDDLNRLFYINETTFFKKYVSKMKHTFSEKDNYNVTLHK